VSKSGSQTRSSQIQLLSSFGITYGLDYIVLKAGLRLAKYTKHASDMEIIKTGTGLHCSKSRKNEDGRQAGDLLLAAR
jgi:hypothetical protein